MPAEIRAQQNHSSDEDLQDRQTIHYGTLLHMEVSTSPSKLYTCNRAHFDQPSNSAEDSHRCTIAHRYRCSDVIGQRVPCMRILRPLPREGQNLACHSFDHCTRLLDCLRRRKLDRKAVIASGGRVINFLLASNKSLPPYTVFMVAPVICRVLLR